MQKVKHNEEYESIFTKLNKLISKLKLYANVQKHTLIPQLLLFVLLFFVYFTFSLKFSGPTILSDEIGYLTKAAFFSGNVVDGASSYHAGYSFVISPAFLLFSDPEVIWKTIMVINSLLMASSFILLLRILIRIFNKKNYSIVLFSTFLSFLIPGLIVINSYAVSSPLFLLAYLLCSYLFLIIDLGRYRTLIPFSLTTGILYWIHPIGLVVTLAGLFVLVIKSRKEKVYKAIFVYLTINLVMIVTYRYIHFLINDALSISTASSVGEHYDRVLNGVADILNIRRLTDFIVMIFGQLSYLLVVTLGIIAFGMAQSLKAFSKILTKQHLRSNNEFLLTLWGLTIIGVIIAGAVTFMSFFGQEQLRIDHWIYGRYTEMVMIPLLAVGILASWKKKHLFFVIFFVLLSGIILSSHVSHENTINYIVMLSIPSFWPIGVRESPSYFYWFAIGGFGIALTYILNKKYLIIMLVPVFVLAVIPQIEWKRELQAYYSYPTGLVNVVRDNYMSDNCIGYQSDYSSFDTYQGQRLNMYLFYFYDYGAKRMTPSEWKENECKLYLTFDYKSFVDDRNYSIVGVEVNYGLYLVSKNNQFIHLEQNYEMIKESGFNLYTCDNALNRGNVGKCSGSE